MQTQLVNFTIPKPLLKKVDQLAKKEMRSRSELLREAVRRYLELEEERQQKKRLFNSIQETAKRVNLSPQEAIKLAEEAKRWARRSH